MFAQGDLIAETEKLQKFALRLTGNKADADDLVQSTCLRALEKAHCFKEGTDLFAWISKIMFNIFATGYRRRTKFETRSDPEICLQKEGVAPAQDTAVEIANVKRAMQQLSAGHREILVLTCVKGVSYQEVSGMLQIPVGPVRSRLSRAREQLQAIMDTPSTRAHVQEKLRRKSVNSN